MLNATRSLAKGVPALMNFCSGCCAGGLSLQTKRLRSIISALTTWLLLTHARFLGNAAKSRCGMKNFESESQRQQRKQIPHLSSGMALPTMPVWPPNRRFNVHDVLKS